MIIKNIGRQRFFILNKTVRIMLGATGTDGLISQSVVFVHVCITVKDIKKNIQETSYELQARMMDELISESVVFVHVCIAVMDVNPYAAGGLFGQYKMMQKT